MYLLGFLVFGAYRDPLSLHIPDLGHDFSDRRNRGGLLYPAAGPCFLPKRTRECNPDERLGAPESEKPTLDEVADFEILVGDAEGIQRTGYRGLRPRFSSCGGFEAPEQRVARGHGDRATAGR